jgi:AraC-like DNA-binding protein
MDSNSIDGICSSRPLQTLVEDRFIYSLDKFELNVFQTSEVVENVSLRFHDPVLASMVSGKKVMHLNGQSAFDFLPGQSVLLNSYETMVIDFPEAKADSPTRCIALAIEEDTINQTLGWLNEYNPRADDDTTWQLDKNNLKFDHGGDIVDSLNRIISVATEKTGNKQALAELSLKDLIVRLAQSQNRELIIKNNDKSYSHNRLAYVIKYIKENVHQPMNIHKLSDMACMSRASFFRAFKRELGVTPVEFILRQRIEFAKKLLLLEHRKVEETCYLAGFNNVNYFIRVFKLFEGTTPKGLTGKVTSFD